jgi:Putative peptidoglycan binding domain
MVRSWSENRKARLGAVCALMLGCVFAAAAQNSTPGSTSEQRAPAQKPASTSSSTNRASSSNSAGGRKTTSKTHTAAGKRSSHNNKKTARARGQQKIDSERAQAIQEALIREHYLTGTPTGTWNQASEDAMRRYQEDNGWQSKTVPDSRALIKLGLGPSKQGLLNPESAMTSVPDPPKSDSVLPTSHTAAPAADPATPPLTPAPTTSSPQ